MYRSSCVRLCSPSAGVNTSRIRLLLAPLTTGVTGSVMDKYGLAEHLRANTAPRPAPLDVNATFRPVPGAFACDWDGLRGYDTQIIDDYFIALLAGFDVESITAERPGNGDDERGTIVLKHSRRFLGWAPTDSVIDVAFDARCTMVDDKLEHVHFASAVVDSLTQAGCPPEITECIRRPEAMAMFVALRRSRVRPEFITHRALSSATKKQEAWSSALGIL
jgi:hypothetical protein